MSKHLLVSIALLFALSPIFPARADRISATNLESLAFLGKPKIDTYYARETGIRGNIHSIAQLPGGEIAVITSLGVFYFDGTRWSALEAGRINQPSTALRLSDESSLIGFDKGVVEIRPNNTGSYSQRYLPQLDETDDNGQPIWSISIANEHIFCSKGAGLLEIRPDETVSFHKLPNWPSRVFTINDQLYVLGGFEDWHLNRWDTDKQELVRAKDVRNVSVSISKWLVDVTPRHEGGVWIRTYENRVIGFDGERCWLWPGNKTLAKRSAQLTCFVETKPGELAIGTASQGILLFDKSGHLAKAVSREDGLSDANVKQIGMDDQNGLWIASRRSVARLDLDFNTLLFDEQHGITDTVRAIEIFDGKLYLGTAAGLVVGTNHPKSKSDAFSPIEGLTGVTDMYAYDDHLFISATYVITLDREGNLEHISDNTGTNLWHPSRFPDLVLACGYRGVQRIERSAGKWHPGPILSGNHSQVFSIAEAKNGDLWGSLGTDKFARIHLDETGGSVENELQRFSGTKGWRYALTIEGDIYIDSEPAVRWDTTSQTFVVDPEMHNEVGEKPYGFLKVVGRSTDKAYLPLNARRSTACLRPNRKVLGRISSVGDTVETRAECIIYDDEGNAWIGGTFGLMLARAPLDPVPPLQEKPRIHKLTSAKDQVNLPVDPAKGSTLTLQPWQDSLIIQTSFPNFATARNVKYRIRMQGLDTTPSEFSSASSREITNLAPGDYHLQVTARYIDGQVSETLDIPITLLAHWYERPWANAMYAGALGLLVFAIVKWNARRLEQKSLELEKTIAKRTQEVESKNKELQQTTESLTETLHTLQKTQDQLLTTARTAGKAEIATNVLHNVGNVLNSVNVNLATLATKVGNSNVSKLSNLATLIESQQHDIKTFLTEDKRGEVVPEFIIHMSRVLQNEINAMGDIIETMGSDVTHLKSIVAAQQTYAKSVGVIQEFSLAELCDVAISILKTTNYSNAIEIANELPRDLLLKNDKERILEIALNLISNARHAIADQKPQRGLITLSAQEADADGFLAIKITDNGVGFDESLKRELFQHGFTTKKDGHGFGLHASANAARALGGSLTLESPGKGKGATATLLLPKSNVPQKPSPTENE